MSYPEGTPERELQDAMQELHEVVDRVVRLNGSILDGYHIQDWVIVGAASTIEETSGITMFAIPGTPMATYQIHGLLDLTDRWLITGEGNGADGEADDA